MDIFGAIHFVLLLLLMIYSKQYDGPNGGRLSSAAKMTMPSYSPNSSFSSFPATYYPQPGIYPAQRDMLQMMVPSTVHQVAQGRMALPHHGMMPHIVNVNPQGTPSPVMDEDYGLSPFLTDDERNSPYGNSLELPPVNDVSPMIMPSHYYPPPTQLDLNRFESHHAYSAPGPHPSQNLHHHQQRFARPPMQQRHSLQVPQRPSQLQALQAIT